MLSFLHLKHQLFFDIDEISILYHNRLSQVGFNIWSNYAIFSFTDVDIFAQFLEETGRITLKMYLVSLTIWNYTML